MVHLDRVGDAGHHRPRGHLVEEPAGPRTEVCRLPVAVIPPLRRSHRDVDVVAGVRVMARDGVVETTGRVRDGQGAVTHGVQLVQAARLETRGH